MQYQQLESSTQYFCVVTQHPMAFASSKAACMHLSVLKMSRCQHGHHSASEAATTDSAAFLCEQ
jgi:hypothetical protein